MSLASVNLIESFTVSSVCRGGFPCEHDTLTIVLLDGRSATVFNPDSLQICSLLKGLNQLGKIGLYQSAWDHFSQYESQMRRQQWNLKKANQTLNHIFTKAVQTKKPAHPHSCCSLV